LLVHTAIEKDRRGYFVVYSRGVRRGCSPGTTTGFPARVQSTTTLRSQLLGNNLHRFLLRAIWSRSRSAWAGSESARSAVSLFERTSARVVVATQFAKPESSTGNHRGRDAGCGRARLGESDGLHQHRIRLPLHGIHAARRRPARRDELLRPRALGIGTEARRAFAHARASNGVALSTLRRPFAERHGGRLRLLRD